MNRYRILNCPIVESPSFDEMKELFVQSTESGRGFYSVAINAEKIMLYNNDDTMRTVIEESFLPYADGSGALLGLRLLHKLKTFKINMPVKVLEICNQTDIPLFLVGSAEDTIDIAVSNIKVKYPDINVVGWNHGFFDDEDELINRIKESGAKIVMIAMGSPRQEILARKILDQLPGNVFIGCGGAFDILAGKVVRAPEWIQRAHLEWLYRLIQNPKRIVRQRVLPVYFFKLIASIRKKNVSSDKTGMA